MRIYILFIPVRVNVARIVTQCIAVWTDAMRT